jgi:dipeptidyl aminopeptidase/acylaminoacyl peptidase
MRSRRYPLRLRARVIFIAVLLMCGTNVFALSVQEAIETTRFVTDDDGRSVFISPDAQRYAIALVHGDVKRDGVWLEIRVGELRARTAPTVIARLFTRALGGGVGSSFGADQLVAEGGNAPFWLDARTLGCFWEDGHGTRQVLAMDVETQAQRWLTHVPTSVMQFATNPQGTFLMRSAVASDLHAHAARASRGYAVQASDALELLSESGRGEWDWMLNELWVVTSSHAQPRRVEIAGGERIARYLPLVAPSFSPDGRYALIAHPIEGEIPQGWVRYTQDHFRDMWRARMTERDGFYSRQFQQFFVVDLEAASARPLWSVPVDGLGRTRMAWSPDGRFVALAPTFLPLEQAKGDGLAGDAIAVVDVATGAADSLSTAGVNLSRLKDLTWPTDGRIEVRDSLRRGTHWERGPGGWGSPLSTPIYMSGPRRSKTHTVEIAQALNSPPVLVRRDQDSSRTHLLLDPNPGLKAHSLGRVEWLERPLPSGRTWTGRLYFPSDYDPTKRYPLIVQTYAFADEHTFSLYGHQGPTLGPGRSAYLAQVLATHGFFVLHGPSRAESIEQVTRLLDDLELQVRALNARGLIDLDRIGIMGFSASGWLTTFALTRTGLRYAAALTDDNKDGSYFQAGLSNWEFAAGEEMIGAPPFGEGLKRWLAYSPAMNVERIHTPLLITRSSPGLPLNGWELFSRLRFLDKPLEYYFVPDVEHGSHGLQNPRQLLGLQARALDWWRFWLQDFEDPAADKHEQYLRWRELRQQRDRDHAAADSSALTVSP